MHGSALIAPVQAVPAGEMVVATAVPVQMPSSGGRTAMLQAGAPFPPVQPDAANLQGGCCSSRVDCAGCFPARDFAMVDGQRFYLSFADPSRKGSEVVDKILPPSWKSLFQPLTDVIVAIDGVFVGIDQRLKVAVTHTFPDKNPALQYIVSVLMSAVQKRQELAGSAATIPFVVLRRTGAGAAAYVVVEAPIGGFPDTPTC